MDHRHEPVRDTVRPAFSRIDAMIPNPNNPGPGCEIAGIAAAAIVAWRAPSPSSPAPRGARRGAASGLDCSVRPSTVAAMPADAPLSMQPKPKFTVTETSYTKVRTLPLTTIAFTPAGMEYLRELLAEHERNRFSRPSLEQGS